MQHAPQPLRHCIVRRRAAKRRDRDAAPRGSAPCRASGRARSRTNRRPARSACRVRRALRRTGGTRPAQERRCGGSVRKVVAQRLRGDDRRGASNSRVGVPCSRRVHDEIERIGRGEIVPANGLRPRVRARRRARARVRACDSRSHEPRDRRRQAQTRRRARRRPRRAAGSDGRAARMRDCSRQSRRRPLPSVLSPRQPSPSRISVLTLPQRRARALTSSRAPAHPASAAA